MRNNDKVQRPSLGVALLRSAVPAYLIPAVTTYLNAQFIPDHGIAHRLAAASVTTIAIPSAVAAALVTLWCRHRVPPVHPCRATSIRAMGLAALACVLLVAAGSLVLIGNGLQPASILQYTISAAAIGGALSARRWARSGRRSKPDATEPTRFARPAVDGDCRLAAGQGIRP